MKKISTLFLMLSALLALPQVARAADYDVEAADIAAFNAAEDGKIVKLTLTNARVNGFNDLAATYYVEDASGATAIKGIGLTKGTALNGYIVGKKGSEDMDYVNTPSQCIEPSLTVTDATLSSFEATATTLVGTPMTITDACAQVNHGKLVTLANITIAPLGNGKNLQLTDEAGSTMKTRDLFGVLPEDYAWPEKASEMTGVLMYYMTGWFLIPISAEAIVEAGAQPLTVTFDFSDPNFCEDIGEKVADPKGNVINDTYFIDNVSLQITAGSAASKLYKDASRGQNLAIYKEFATMTFRAPEGYAITAIEFTAAGNSNIDKFIY